MAHPVIPFEPKRFEGAAPHYLQGRPPYAAGLVRRVAERVGLAPSHHVLDLGCGPGQLATAFAYFGASVLAMDPEPEMLAVAASRAEGVVTNVTFIQGSSFDLRPEIGEHFGPFRLATIGRAFHWMDRAETLRRLDRLILPGGAVALFADTHPDMPQNDWLTEFRAIRQRFTGPAKPAWRQPGWARHEAILLDSPFCRLERIGLIERRQVPPARLVDRALSMSSSSRARLGPAVDTMAAEIAAFAARIAEDGLVSEVVESTALVAFRSA